MNLFTSMALKVRAGSVLLSCFLMILIVWSFPSGLLAIKYMQEDRYGDLASSNFKETETSNADRNGTHLANSDRAGEFLLEVLAAGPIDRLIICNEGQTPQQYHDFKDLKTNDYLDLKIIKKFKLYASSIEHVRFRINYGPEKEVLGKGAGKFVYLHEEVQSVRDGLPKLKQRKQSEGVQYY
jgi:hypothetical protein